MTKRNFSNQVFYQVPYEIQKEVNLKNPINSTLLICLYAHV
jgi:hypothetical protein